MLDYEFTTQCLLCLEPRPLSVFFRENVDLLKLSFIGTDISYLLRTESHRSATHYNKSWP